MERLLSRFGYVKLNRYGLVLTPEGRILSMRHAVLDDGFGGRIVGWMDTDLVATQLNQWESKKAQIMSQAALAPTVPVMAARPIPVAPAAEAPEDDWEWTIAIARARAEAETPIARSSIPSIQPRRPAAALTARPEAVPSIQPRRPAAALTARPEAVPSLAQAPARAVPQVITGSVPSLAQQQAPIRAVKPTSPPPVPMAARRPNNTVPPPIVAKPAPVTRPIAVAAPTAPKTERYDAVRPENIPSIASVGIVASKKPSQPRIAPVIPIRRAPTAPPKLARAASPQTVIPVPKLPRIAKGTNQVIPTPRSEMTDADTQVGLDLREIGESTRVDLPRVAR